MNNAIIGKQIKYYRTRAALTLIELGEQIGVSKQCLSGWEHGRNMPDPISLYKLAKIFNIKLEDFYTDSEDFYDESIHKNMYVHETSEVDCSGALSLTSKEVQFIHKMRAMNKSKRKAVEVLCGIREKM